MRITRVEILCTCRELFEDVCKADLCIHLVDQNKENRNAYFMCEADVSAEDSRELCQPNTA